MASFFNEAYKGTPPWDIGRPQAEFVRVAREGGIHGRVLDVGCGTGENAIFFASLAPEVFGVGHVSSRHKEGQKEGTRK